VRPLVHIDGSRGEGGGQILRTALTLSAWSGTPFTMTAIRAGRRRPGLRPQHLAAVNGVAAITHADVRGATEGSIELDFRPRGLHGGDYAWEIGTAGATTLVAQTVALPLLRSPDRSRIAIGGGTHVAWAPPFDHLSELYIPLLHRLGFPLRATLVRHGFYPRGGGRIELEIADKQTRGASAPPAHDASARPADHDPPRRARWVRPERERIAIRVTAVVCSLSRSIAERMLAVAGRELQARGWPCETQLIEAEGGPGTYLFVRAVAWPGDEPALGPPATATPLLAGGFTGLGERGMPAEQVARDAVAETLAFLDSEAVIDARLADQLLLPALLGGWELEFRTDRITNHLRTNTDTIAAFLGPRVSFDATGMVRVRASES
jgi:RNA 3'-terminal phosphate cyclase (ATP)